MYVNRYIGVFFALGSLGMFYRFIVRSPIHSPEYIAGGLMAVIGGVLILTIFFSYLYLYLREGVLFIGEQFRSLKA
jgi:hypothetical protein